MKKNIRLLVAAILAISVTFTSCKKDDKGTTDTTDLAVHSDDQSRVSQDMDEIADESNDFISTNADYQGRPGGTESVICGATAVYDSTATDKRITITYDGVNCLGNRNRVGVVVLTMPLNQNWGQAGAVLTVDVQNLRVTRLRDNKSIVIDGTTTITNVSGGRIYELAGMSDPIEHRIESSGISVTFDNGSQRNWQVAKKRVFSYDNGIVITTTGLHTDGSTTGISEWGTNRFGNPFTTAITSPMTIRQDCNFRLTSGEVTHRGLAATVVTTFGLDSAGNPTSCPGQAGVYYFKTVWTGVNGIVRTYIWPY